MFSFLQKIFSRTPNETRASPAPPPELSAVIERPGPEDITITLKGVVAALPDNLKSRLDKKLSGSEVIWIPREEATRQLKVGAVRIPFSEIVRMAPQTFVKPDSEMLATPVSLPLSEILPQIKTFPRRAEQKQVEIPSDLAPVFGNGRESSGVAAPAATPTFSAPTPQPPSRQTEGEALSIPAPIPKPVPSPVPKLPDPPASAPAAASIPMAPAAVPSQAAAVGDGPVIPLGDVFGQPDKKDWSPQEVVEKASSLRGVAGALITTVDGLPVAFHLPAHLSGNTVAAFVPQMYTRIIQYTRDLQLGDPKHLTILIENVPLQMFKAGGVYFTALGRANESLPKPQLTAIALALGRQSPP